MPASTFLPLTRAVIADVPAPTPGARRLLLDAARRAERDAGDVWQALLGGCVCPARARLPTQLRRLSGAVGAAAGLDWWNGPGSGHRDRAAGCLRWLGDALLEADGAGFAEAFAGYDAALAGALVSAPAPARRPGRRSGRADGAVGRPCGTMAGWARQARAVTSQAVRQVVSPLRWATSRPATSSSRWSRRSRSAG